FEEIYIRFYYHYPYTSIESNENNLTDLNYQFDEIIFMKLYEPTISKN
ncbi:10818_t:CDS:1, partial [Dentiscutata heterogama]